MSNKYLILLQCWNDRHYGEYHGCVKLELTDCGNGYLKCGNDIIPGTYFNDLEQLEAMLLSE